MPNHVSPGPAAQPADLESGSSGGVARHRFLVLVFATTLTSIMANGLLSPVIPDILHAFGRPDRDGPLLVAAASLPGIFVAPVVGLLADRWGRRPVLASCLAIFGGAGLAAALAPSFGLLLGFRFVMGIGGAGLVNLAIVLIGDRFVGLERTRLIGINAGVLTIALALFPIVAGGLSELGGWRLALAPYGFGLIAAAFTWWSLPTYRASGAAPLADQLRGARAVLGQPLIIINNIAAMLLFAIIFGVFLGTLPTVLERAFGLSAGWRGLMLGIPAVSSSITAFNLGRIRRRFSTATVLIGCATAWVVGFVVMGLAGSVLLLAVGTFVYGFGEGAMIPSLQNAALDRSPIEHRAVVLATWTASARLGQTVGPLVAAVVIASASDTAAVLMGAVGSTLLLSLYVFARFLSLRDGESRGASGDSSGDSSAGGAHAASNS